MRAALGFGIAWVAVVAIGIGIGSGLGCNAIIGLQPGIGLCEGVTCQEPDVCHEKGTCNPDTGECSYPTLEDGMSCDDGKPCTKTSMCQGGTCVGQGQVDCSAIDPCHPGMCDPKTGCAVNDKAPDGTSCDDGDLCTREDTCRDGTCMAGVRIECAGIACHTGECKRETGCVSQPDMTSCNDGNVCSSLPTCRGGSCNPGGDHKWTHWDLHAPPPSPRFVYTDNVVFDRLTGLTWQRNVEPGVTRDNWQAARAYCQDTFKLPEYPSGWRLPTRIELASILDYTIIKGEPAIDTQIFGDVGLTYPDYFFWTSSSVNNNKDKSWVVSFRAGYIGILDNSNPNSKETYKVRCVR